MTAITGLAGSGLQLRLLKIRFCVAVYSVQCTCVQSTGLYCAVAGLVGHGEGVAVFHGQILQMFREASSDDWTALEQLWNCF